MPSIFDLYNQMFPAAMSPPPEQLPFGQMLEGLYQNRVIPVPHGTAENAWSSLYGMTGLPDIQAGASAFGRGEPLQGVGQVGAGLASLAALAAPVARGAMTFGREALGAVPGVLGDTTGAIRAFHGSPYDFDRFDMGKIGTGEGAQAYGHGLYFAENPETAQIYRDQVKNMPLIDTVNARLSEIARERDKIRESGALFDKASPERQRFTDLAAEYDRLMEEKLKPGRMYEASINAEPEHFLDWDKPLSAQAVQEKIASLAQNMPKAGWFTREPEATLRPYRQERLSNPESTGADVYSALSRALGETDPAAASAALREAGIPGIRYRDAGSRGPDPAAVEKSISYAESVLREPNLSHRPSWESRLADLRRDLIEAQKPKTNNYVVFDDKLIDILKKYGLAGLFAGGTGAVGAQNQGGF